MENNQKTHEPDTLTSVNENIQNDASLGIPQFSDNTQIHEETRTQGATEIPGSSTKPPADKNRPGKILLMGIILLLAVLLVGGAYFYLQNRITKSPEQTPIQTQEQPSPTPNPTITWITFENEDKIFNFKYPSSFLTGQENGDFIFFSEPVNCKTGVTGSEREISINEVYIRTGLRTGESYESIWKNTYGYEFDSSSYDREITIDGKRGYYFYQGAESPTGSQFILIEISDQKALEIVIEKPVLVYDCTDPINKYEDVADQILSTFKFTATIKEPGQICGEGGGKWLSEYNECESASNDTGIDQTSCRNLGGTYTDCASPCRHDPGFPDEIVCASVCVYVCAF